MILNYFLTDCNPRAGFPFNQLHKNVLGLFSVESQLAEQRKEIIRESLITSQTLPELPSVEPIPASLWKQAKFAPWVLHRVSSLLASSYFTPDDFSEGKASSLKFLSPSLPTKCVLF